MKIWILYQDSNQNGDHYDSCIVVAATEDDARAMYPHTKPHYYWFDNSWRYSFNGTEYVDDGAEWVRPDEVVVEYLGESYKTEPEVILSSYIPRQEVSYL